MDLKTKNTYKKQFLTALIKDEQFENPYIKRILSHILNDRQLLSLTYFVTDLSNCPRSLSLSTVDYDDLPLLFQKEHVKTENGLQAYHDLRLNNDEALYIKVNMKGHYSDLYDLVLQYNPFVHESATKKVTNEQLDTFTRTQMKDKLERKIDEALSQHDKAAFIRLTNELLRLK